MIFTFEQRRVPQIRRVAAASVLALLVGGSHRRIGAQSPADPKLDALAALAEAKMKEYGVPGVAIGIINNGVASTRGLGISKIMPPS